MNPERGPSRVTSNGFPSINPTKLHKVKKEGQAVHEDLLGSLSVFSV